MAKRAKHVGKNNADKQFYTKAIKAVDYESTNMEDYASSNESSYGGEIETTPSDRKRPSAINEIIFDHIKKNWFAWILVFVGMGVTYYIFNLSWKMGGMEGTLSETKNTVGRHEEKLEKLSEKIQDQNFKIYENSFKIESLKEKAKKNN